MFSNDVTNISHKDSYKQKIYLPHPNNSTLNFPKKITTPLPPPPPPKKKNLNSLKNQHPSPRKKNKPNKSPQSGRYITLLFCGVNSKSILNTICM